MKYEDPIMSVIIFGDVDIIRTSDIIGGGLGGDSSGDGSGSDVNTGKSRMYF